MAETSPLPPRPSDDLAVLERQLLNALDRLEKEEAEAQGPESYRPYLRHAQVLAWHGVARRRPGTPREVLDHLQAVQPFIDAFLPVPAGPREEAALALYFALDSLYLADGALEESRVESRLANRDLSLTEREVLRILLVNRDRYLRRGEVQKLLNLTRRPTPARISQILVNLDHENLLVRMQGRAQGNPEASFYALSPQGLEVCHRLGLDRRRVPYFRLEEESWKAYLTPERIAVHEDIPMDPGRVTAVWSYRGGVGRTTAIAQAAPLLAERMREANAGRLLVIDFDLDSPGLDTHFAPEGLGECRGLRGLIVDFYRVPPAERSKWLREALLAPGYVLQPKPVEHPDLFYLPSGFSPSATPGLDEELGEAYDRLQSEARRRLGSGVEEGDDTGPAFLSELRQALREDLYARTLVDSHAGLGLSAWAAVQELADELVLCACLSNLSSGPLKIVLGNFLCQQSERTGETVLRVGFLVTRARPGAEGDLNAWIEREVLQVTDAKSNSYRTMAVSANEEVDWLYLLEDRSRERTRRWRYRTSVSQYIDAAFDHSRRWEDRRNAAGILTAIQDPVLSKVVIETVLEKARVSVAGAFDAAFLHDLEVDNQSLRRVEETLATLKLAQGVALNLATTYAYG